jgi:hypothetical protein
LTVTTDPTGTTVVLVSNPVPNLSRSN